MAGQPLAHAFDSFAKARQARFFHQAAQCPILARQASRFGQNRVGNRGDKVWIGFGAALQLAIGINAVKTLFAEYIAWKVLGIHRHDRS